MSENKQDFIGYALRYGGMCRDCADSFGVCPHSGMPCKSEQCRAVMSHALQAWRYGVAHGYIDNPIPDETLRARAEDAAKAGAERDAAIKEVAKWAAAAGKAEQAAEAAENERDNWEHDCLENHKRKMDFYEESILLRIRAEKAEAERNLYIGKYRSIASLMEKARSDIGYIARSVCDEGDRVYFGSTNHADELKDFVSDMQDWLFDFDLPKGDINKMERDPYAEIRNQRTRAEAAEAERDVNLAAFKAIEAESNQLREVATVNRHRAEAAEARVKDLEADKSRLDFLDHANQCLNARYGTTYRWKLIMNHNVNRLILGAGKIDLSDMETDGLVSCRDAIDQARAALAAYEARKGEAKIASDLYSASDVKTDGDTPASQD